jgi:hypothetical protein
LLQVSTCSGRLLFVNVHDRHHLLLEDGPQMVHAPATTTDHHAADLIAPVFRGQDVKGRRHYADGKRAALEKCPPR